MFLFNLFKKKLEWKRGEKTPVNYFVGALSSCGVTEKNVFEKRKKSNSLNDALWSVCNESLLKYKDLKKWDCVSYIYRQMEYIILEEGKNVNYIVKQRLYYELLRMKEQGFSLAIVVCIKDEACDACKKLDGMEMQIDEAIQKQVLPPSGCSCQRCTCSY
jgi:hypothetical protein